MPAMNGIYTLRVILAQNPCAKIIMCTIVDNREVIEDCLTAGAVDYICKDMLNEIPARLQPYLKQGGNTENIPF